MKYKDIVTLVETASKYSQIGELSLVDHNMTIKFDYWIACEHDFFEEGDETLTLTIMCGGKVTFHMFALSDVVWDSLARSYYEHK